MKVGTYMIYTDKLVGEYKEAFKFVEHYADIHMIGGHYKNEKLMDLLDLIMQAQENERPVEEIVGKDKEQYAKDFYSDVTLPSLCENLFSKLKIWAWLVLVFEGLMVLSKIGEEDFNIFTFKADMSGYLQGFLIAYLGVMLADIISIILAKFKYYNEKLNVGLMIGLTLLTIVGCIYMGVNEITISVRSFPVMLCALVFLIVYYVVEFSCRIKKTGSIKKEQDDYDTTFGGLVKAELEIENNKFERKEDLEFLRTISKRYSNKNNKRVSKGLSPLTTREYIDLQNKLGKNACMGGYFFGVTAAFIATLANSGFESIVDAGVFVLIMAVFGFFLYKIQKFINSVSEQETNRILYHCEERGVEMDELYQQLSGQLNDC